MSYEEKDWFFGLWGVVARIPAYTAIEMLFMVLYHLGKELLRNPESTGDILALNDLCSLIYLNTLPKKDSNKKIKKWQSKLIKDKEIISIYPSSEQDKPNVGRKRCLLM